MATIRDMRPEHDAVEVVVTSAVDLGQSQQVMREALEFMASIGVWRSLCDFAEAHQSASSHDAVLLADALVEATPPEWRQAILRPRDLNSAMAMATWEAACNNRKRACRLFGEDERDAALAWLLEQDAE